MGKNKTRVNNTVNGKMSVHKRLSVLNQLEAHGERERPEAGIAGLSNRPPP
jgi:hypothetical protein